MRRSLSAVARAMSSSDTVARIASSDTRASLDGALAFLGRRPQLRGRLVGLRHVQPEGFERAHVFVQLLFACDDRRLQIASTPLRLVAFYRKRGGTRLEFRPGFLESLDFTREGRCALDERRVRSSRFSRLLAQRLGRLPGFEKPALSRGQTLVRRPLFAFESSDRDARLGLTSIDHLALVVGLAPFARQLLELQGKTGGLVGGLLYPRVVPNDRLLLLVMLGGERDDRAQRLRDRRVERRRFLGKAGQLCAFGVDTLAEIPDFAAGLQDAARFAPDATGHEIGTAKHLACNCDHRTGGNAARGLGTFVRIGNPRFADRASNRVGIVARARAPPKTESTTPSGTFRRP